MSLQEESWNFLKMSLNVMQTSTINGSKSSKTLSRRVLQLTMKILSPYLSFFDSTQISLVKTSSLLTTISQRWNQLKRKFTLSWISSLNQHSTHLLWSPLRALISQYWSWQITLTKFVSNNKDLIRTRNSATSKLLMMRSLKTWERKMKMYPRSAVFLKTTSPLSQFGLRMNYNPLSAKFNYQNV
jgi:hypothetical protein